MDDGSPISPSASTAYWRTAAFADFLDGDIEDPAGQGEEAFRYCRDEIVRCLEKVVPRLLEDKA